MPDKLRRKAEITLTPADVLMLSEMHIEAPTDPFIFEGVSFCQWHGCYGYVGGGEMYCPEHERLVMGQPYPLANVVNYEPPAVAEAVRQARTLRDVAIGIGFALVVVAIVLWWK